MLPLLLLVAVDVETLAKAPGVARIERALPGERLIVHMAD